MTEYGLAGLRDADGERKPVDHTFRWADSEVTIKFLPPTIAELDEIENLEEDADTSEMEAILDRHLIKPEIDGSWTAAEMWAFIQGIQDHASGGQLTVAQDIQDEIESRSDGLGN